MKRVGIIAIVSSSIFLLSACVGPQIHHGQLVVLNKGMDPATTIERLKQVPLSSHTTRVADVEYRFHRYRMNNGISHALYLLAFEEDRLEYWGYVDDFRRHPDERLNRAASQVLMDVYAAQQQESMEGSRRYEKR